MSVATDGAAAPEICPPALDDNRLRFSVVVDPACIEAGYNAAGPTLMSVDAARLTPQDRGLLRRLLKPADGRDPGAPHRLLFKRREIRLSEPTLRALTQTFALIRESAVAETVAHDLSAEAERLLLAALVRVLPRFVPDGDFYRVSPTLTWALFPDAVIEAVREDCGRALQAAGEAAHEARVASATLDHRIGALDHWSIPGDKPVDWIGETLRSAPAQGYLARMEGDWAEAHRAREEATTTAHAEEVQKAEYARSPKGRIEAVIAERGTSSQRERWRAGVLPDEETDALVAAHLFREVLEAVEPETRLDRDAVARALRAVRPGASLTKVSFSTEEAQGLAEAEWESFKAIRAALPEKASAHVVRTLAHVLTATDGSFVARRPLASLKGTFAGREVRLRVDLGLGIGLQAA